MALTVDSYTEEIKSMRDLHGRLVFDENSFLKKVGQKNDKLNEQAAKSYQSLWKDQNQLKDNETFVDHRREQAQTMTNSFYDLVTDFYEYGKKKKNDELDLSLLRSIQAQIFFMLMIFRMGKIIPFRQAI
jgi:hypothetical protein